MASREYLGLLVVPGEVEVFCPLSPFCKSSLRRIRCFFSMFGLIIGVAVSLAWLSVSVTLMSPIGSNKGFSVLGLAYFSPALSG
jgi:hypothetical protein